MRASEAVAGGQGTLETGQYLRPAQQAQRTRGRRLRAIEMPGKYWPACNAQRENPSGAQRR
jgi:hypothetical protein